MNDYEAEIAYLRGVLEQIVKLGGMQAVVARAALAEADHFARRRAEAER